MVSHAYLWKGQSGSDHVREAVQDPNGQHQIRIDLSHQLLLGFGFPLERRLHDLDGTLLLRLHRGVSYSILLLVHGGNVADPLDFGLPEVAVWVFGLRRHGVGKCGES